MLEKRQRKSIRLKEYDYSQPGEYFVTICTRDKRCYFGEVVDEVVRLSPIGVIAKQCWEGIPKHFSNAELDVFENKMPRYAGQHSQASGCPTICMEF